MSDGRPWDVPEDLQYILWLIRRARRLIMRIEGEPERKGRGGKRSAVAFQQQVMDEMERYGRYPMTGPLALDLHFTAARKNPASIHHVASTHWISLASRCRAMSGPVAAACYIETTGRSSFFTST
jgi:hypothetical protein